MVSPNEKLAESLKILKILQDSGVIALRSKDLTRTHRERLLKNGFLQETMKGWYIPVRQQEFTGESTAWYASFWNFCIAYLNGRFGSLWCISPEQSLLLHVGNMTVPRQLIVRSPKARNKITKLPHNTSLLDIRATLPAINQVVDKDGLRLFAVPEGLVNCAPGFFQQYSTDARAALGMVNDSSHVLALLLEGGKTTVAGRLAGAFRNIGRDRIADDIVKTMQTAGYGIREKDPFEDNRNSILPVPQHSPGVNRIGLMWSQMRDLVLINTPPAPEPLSSVTDYLRKADDSYVNDAYHSLSIEGYRVSHELIERVRSGDWDPDENMNDREQINTLAALGYWQAYKKVRDSVRAVLEGKNPGVVCRNDHRDWYREMFGPGVTAGLLRATDLAGYRDHQVYIRNSMHVPPRHEAVRDYMPVFFDLLEQEPEPWVRVVMGHFMFVYIHPYMDGNGRIGRFLMNVMLAAGGYPWTVIPVEKRDAYIDALEKGSATQDIRPFTKFLGSLVTEKLAATKSVHKKPYSRTKA
ncbi:MAG: Fic family protein [Deltaproteobacteria bacterium]|nr:Fic family protein [Deltaproteobacteria bacterium]